MVSWVRCGASLNGFLIFAFFLILRSQFISLMYLYKKVEDFNISKEINCKIENNLADVETIHRWASLRIA